MERPGAALVGSVLVHAALAGAFAYGLLSLNEREPLEMVSAVPVSIVSETVVIEAAAADNPSEELVTDDAATAPVASEPEPSPPEPQPASQPTPPPPAPRPAPAPPTPRPDPAPPRRPAPVPKKVRPEPAPAPAEPAPPRARPTPSQPAPARPAPARPQPSPAPEPGLDLDALAGPPRPSSRPGQRASTGQQGRGSAPRAVGRASLQALGAQVRPRLNCDLPGSSSTVVRVVVRLNEAGRIVGSPRLDGPRTPISESVLRAIQAAQPFQMPSEYEEQDIPFVFNTSTWC